MCHVLSCQFVLDPTHLVSWLLVNLPHPSFLATLLICSLYNRLVFAVLCQFVIECFLFLPCLALSCVLPCLALPCLALPCLALPCLALPCLALPCLALPCPASCPAFPIRGSFSLFVLFIFKLKTHSPVLASFLHPQPWQKCCPPNEFNKGVV